jgi:uncharacterized protein (DUF488 family)
MNKIYTIGHSNQSLDEFYEMLKNQGITCIIDVRSMPYSKYTSQFNKESISAFLKQKGILYAHFGLEFGARRDDCLIERTFVKNKHQISQLQVDFLEGMKTPNFLKGIERLNKAISQGFTVSLMCSEADPLECHRFSFLSRYLFEHNWNVEHIIKDTNGETTTKHHALLEKEMVTQYTQGKRPKLTKVIGEMSFMDMNPYTAKDQIADAYILKNDEIGYCPDNIAENDINY